MKTSSTLFRTVLLATLILSANQAFPQSKFELSGGYGVPELFNLGIKYGQNVQIGAYGGVYPFEWYGNTFVDWSCGIEIIYHFTGKSKFVEQAPWYILGGLAYHDLGVMVPYEEYDISVCPRIGRTLNFSKRWGMNLDIGLFLPLSMTSDYDTYDFKFLPSGNIGFFIRL
jgi:hypothetical protein